jgi:hypothetical protein
VESHGDEGVREKRKEMVRRVEQKLQELEGQKRAAWEKVRKSGAASEDSIAALVTDDAERPQSPSPAVEAAVSVAPKENETTGYDVEFPAEDTVEEAVVPDVKAEPEELPHHEEPSSSSVNAAEDAYFANEVPSGSSSHTAATETPASYAPSGNVSHSETSLHIQPVSTIAEPSTPIDEVEDVKAEVALSEDEEYAEGVVKVPSAGSSLVHIPLEVEQEGDGKEAEQEVPPSMEEAALIEDTSEFIML